MRGDLADLRRAGRALLAAAQASISAVHPLDASTQGLAGVVFTGPPEGTAQLRCQPIYADGAADRSPSGTAVWGSWRYSTPWALPAATIAIESLSGTAMTGRVIEQVAIGDVTGVRVEIEASAWIVAEHAFVLESEIHWRMGSRGEHGPRARRGSC